jgi:hypothetical protein
MATDDSTPRDDDPAAVASFADHVAKRHAPHNAPASAGVESELLVKLTDMAVVQCELIQSLQKNVSAAQAEVMLTRAAVGLLAPLLEGLMSTMQDLSAKIDAMGGSR